MNANQKPPRPGPLPPTPPAPAESSVPMPDAPPAPPVKAPVGVPAVSALVDRISRELCRQLIVNHADSLAAAFALDRVTVGDMLRSAAGEFCGY